MSKPNIILISIDTLRFDHLSCNGYHRQTTPNLDRIAAEGVQFTNAYSTAVWTPPAHASMFTGLYPSQHGVIDENRLNEQIPTLAEMLRNSGYHTAGFVNNPQVGALTNLHRGHDSFYEVWKGLAARQVFRRVVHKTQEKLGYADNRANKTNRLVRNWVRSKKPFRKPLYIFIHYIEAHNPLTAPRPFKGKFLDKKWLAECDMHKMQKVARNPLICLTDSLQLNEAEIALLTSLYDEEIAYVDHRIGELYRWLQSEGLLDDTLLIITADHGEHLGEKGLFSHVASLFEPIVHVPLIMRYPREIEESTTSEALVQLVDIVPTVLKAAAVEDQPSNLPGIPLLPLIGEERYHDYIIAEWEGRIPHFVRSRLAKINRSHETDKYTNKLTMIRQGAYKFICGLNGRKELYHLENDKDELRNLVEDHPEIADRLAETLENWRDKTGKRAAMVRENYQVDELVKKRLQDLGYI